MVHTLGKYFFEAAIFKGLWDVSFQTLKKFVVCLVCMSLLWKDQKDTVYGREI